MNKSIILTNNAGQPVLIPINRIILCVGRKHLCTEIILESNSSESTIEIKVEEKVAEIENLLKKASND